MSVFPVAARVTANTGSFVTAMGAGSASLRAFAGAAGLATGALGVMAGAAAMGAAVKAATEYQAELVKLNTLVGIQTEQIEAYSEGMKALAEETGKAPADLARAMFAITSGGARGAEAMAILTQAAKASSVGLGDMTEIGRVATAALQAFGDTGLTAEKAIDVMLATVRAGNLEASELAGSLGRVMGTAAAMGVGLEDLGAFVATYTRLGVNARVATTGLNAALNIMLRPTTEARAKMEELGIPVEKLRDTLRQDGLNAALMEMKNAIGDNVDSLGTVIPNVRALSSVLGTVGVQSEAYVQIQKEVNESNGLTNEGFKVWGDTAEATFARFNQAVGTLAISFGEVLLPPLELIVRTLQPFVQLLGKAVDVADDLFRAFARDVGGFFDNEGRQQAAAQELADRLQDLRAEYDAQGLSLEELRQRLAAARDRQAHFNAEADRGVEKADQYRRNAANLAAEIMVLNRMVLDAENAQAELNETTQAAAVVTQGQIEAEQERREAIDEIAAALETELLVLKEGERALLQRELTTLRVTDTTREMILSIYDEIEAIRDETEARREAEREAERSFATAARRKEQSIRQSQRERKRLIDDAKDAARAIEEAQLEQKMRDISDVSTGMADTIGDGFESVINGTQNVSAAFGNMVTQIISDLQRLAIRKAITEPLTEALFEALGGEIAQGSTGGSVGKTVAKGPIGFSGSKAGLTLAGGQPKGQSVVVQQTVNFAPSFIDGQDGANWLRTNSNEIMNIISDGARRSSSYASALRG